MGEAFLWGVVGGSSLVLGGIIALRAPITRRHREGDRARDHPRRHP
jgi:hypothetical protein